MFEFGFENMEKLVVDHLKERTGATASVTSSDKDDIVEDYEGNLAGEAHQNSMEQKEELPDDH